MSILSILIILSSIFIFTAHAVAKDSHEIEIYSNEDLMEGLDEDIARMLVSQEPAQEAYSEFLTQLPIDEEGDYVYPSTFSGAYLDKETYELCIALTDCSDDVQEQYDHFFSDPSIVVYKEAEYSYNELKEIENILLESYRDTCEIGISQKENVVKVGIIYDTTQICSEVDPELPVVFYQQNRVKTAALQGGDYILNKNNGYSFTLGMCGTYNGKNAILLCGHGMKVGDKITYDGKEIATVVKVQFADNQKYDYAIATINSGANVVMSNKVLNDVNYTTITSALSNMPLEDSLVCKYGQTQGFGVYRIEEIGISVPVESGSSGVIVDIGGLVKCNHFRENWTEKGDSGGPCYSGHILYGTISSFMERNLESAPFDDMYFSPISGVTSSFRVKTS